MKIDDPNLCARLVEFHDQVKRSFAFLQKAHKMRRGRMKLKSMDEPRDASASICYSGGEMDVAVGWGVYTPQMDVTFLNANDVRPRKPKVRARSIADVPAVYLTDVVRHCTDGKVRFSLDRIGWRRFADRKKQIDSQMRMLIAELAALCVTYAMPILEGDHDFVVSVANSARRWPTMGGGEAHRE